MMNNSNEPQFVHVGTVPLEEAESTFNQSCDAMLGRTVYVGTINGHGWLHNGHDHFPGYPGVPTPFTAKIIRFFEFRSNPRRGFCGVGVQPNHPFDGWWVICCIRYSGCFDFAERLSGYNLVVSPREPRMVPATDPRCTPHWPFFDVAGGVFSTGFADIAETPEYIATWFERLRTAQS